MHANQDFLGMLQQGINTNDEQLIHTAIYSIVNQGQKVQVHIIRQCTTHPPPNNFFLESSLYCCPNSHPFCKSCLQEQFFHTFSNYGCNCDYYCPVPMCNLPLYLPNYKMYFINSIIGEFFPSMTQYSETKSFPPTTYYSVGQAETYTHMQSIENQLFIPLFETSSEFLHVRDLFFMTLIDRNKFSLEAVYRVNNPGLARSFEEKKAELARHSNKILEVWHGTKSLDIYRQICLEGFKIGGIDVKNKHGTAYGTGVNTGQDPYVCLHYTEDCGYLLLCDGLPGLISQDSNRNKGGNSYKGGNVHVFYEKNQVLPKYLLKYNRIG